MLDELTDEVLDRPENDEPPGQRPEAPALLKPARGDDGDPWDAVWVSATLVARGLAAGHGDRVLFSGLDLVVAPGDVVGLVGANGAGKSTLLRMLAGRDRRPRPGTVVVSPPSATLGYLPQEPERRPGETVPRPSPGAPASPPPRRRSTHAAERSAQASDGADERLRRRARALARPRRRRPGGARRRRWSRTSRRASPSTRSWPVSPAARRPASAWPRCCSPATTCSCSTSRPTTSTWTASTSSSGSSTGSRAGIVVVSHDREFLARTVTRVVELDLAQQLVNVYGGGYDAYLEERDVARRHAREEYEEYADTKAGLEARARMQRNWMEKGVRDSSRRRRTATSTSRPRTGRDGEAGGQGAADRPADRAARGGRGAAQGVGAAAGDRRRTARRRRRRHPARRRRAARRVHPRAGRPAGRLGRPGRHHRAERLRQVDPAGRAARPGPARRGDGVPRARRRGRRGRPGPRAVLRAARR